MIESWDREPNLSLEWDSLADDALLPSQVSTKNIAYQTFEQKIAINILWSALEDLRQSFVPHTKDQLKRNVKLGEKRFLRRETLDWFYTDYSHTKEAQLDFLLVCDALGIDNPDLIRRVVDICCMLWSHTSGNYPQITFYGPARDVGHAASEKIGSDPRKRRKGLHLSNNSLRVKNVCRCCF